MGKIYQALEKSKMNGTETLDEEEPIVTAPEVEATDESGNTSQYVNEQNYPSDSYMQIPENIDKTLVAVLKPESPEAEQFRLLKNNLLFPEKEIHPKVS